LVFDDGTNNRFSGASWTRRSPIEVFDAAFIAENLFAGEKVELEHDRSLFTVILGRAGVKLARQQEFFNGAAKRRAAILKAAETALADDIPSDMSREEFLGHVPGPTIDDQIEGARKEMKGAQQATRLAALKLLSHVSPLIFPVDLRATLRATVHDIQASARERLTEHFTTHKLGRQGETWLRFGREHIVDDECPFCGREGVDELGLVTVYDQIFGEKYQAHFGAVKAALEQIEAALGAVTREHLARAVSANGEAAWEWGEFCDLSGIQIPEMGAAFASLEAAYQRLKPLIDAKRGSPLEVIEDEEAWREADEQLAAVADAFRAYNEAVAEINRRGERRLRLISLSSRARHSVSVG
jgi:wobble nucleotide-excising tRNase